MNTQRCAIILQKVLEERGISKYSLAKNTGLNPSTIQRYCQPDCRKIKLDDLARICYALNCDVVDIIVEK